MINYTKQYIDEKDIYNVTKSLKSSYITQGLYVRKFETDLAKYFGSKYSIVVNSGTSALDLACKSIGIKKNDKVVTTPITFLASSNSAIYNGAKIKFIDIEKDTFLMDLNKFEKYLKKNHIKLAVMVDFAGNVNDWDKIRYLSKKYNFLTINDTCHAIGSKFKKNLGYAVKYADIVTHSYHAAKIITTGEGGSILTNNKRFYERAKILRSHGVIKSEQINKKKGLWFYNMRYLGYNYRLSDLNCALGITQLKKLNIFLKKRSHLVKNYISAFEKYENISFQKVGDNVDHSYHLFILKINFKNFKISKKLFFEKLKRKGISLQVHYIPIFLQSYYRKKFNFNINEYKNSMNYYNCAVTLPVFHQLTFKDQIRIINSVKQILRLK